MPRERICCLCRLCTSFERSVKMNMKAISWTGKQYDRYIRPGNVMEKVLEYIVFRRQAQAIAFARTLGESPTQQADVAMSPPRF